MSLINSKTISRFKYDFWHSFSFHFFYFTFAQDPVLVENIFFASSADQLRIVEHIIFCSLTVRLLINTNDETNEKKKDLVLVCKWQPEILYKRKIERKIPKNNKKQMEKK